MVKYKILAVVLCIGFCLGGNTLFAQNFNVSFRHIDAAEMLPENHVSCFLQDSTGFVWLGTQNGLVRFDGVNTKIFQYTPNDSSGLKGYSINKIIKDKDGNLWIGSDFGVNFYDIHKNTFKNFPIIPSTGAGENGMCYAKPLTIDENGKLWLFVATRYALYTLDTHTGELEHIPCEADVDFGVLTGSIPGKIKKVGFRLLQGVVLYDAAGNKMINGTEYFTPGGKFSGLVINEARPYFDNNDSIAWITCDKGLIKLNYKSNSYKLFNNFNTKAIGKTADLCFYKNLIFVASAYNGLFVFDKNKDGFTAMLENSPLDANSLQSNKLSRLFVSGNTLFACFEAGGLDFTNLQTVFSHYASRHDVAQFGIKNQVSSICNLTGDKAWLGTAETGLISFNTSAGIVDTLTTALLSKRLAARQINHITTNATYTAIGSNEGLFILTNNNLSEQHRLPIIQTAINYSEFFNDSILLATTNDGLYQVNIGIGHYIVKPVEDFNIEHNFRNLAVYHKPGTNIVYVLAESGSFLHEMEFANNTFHIKRKLWLSQGSDLITGGRSKDELLLCGPHGIFSFNTRTFLGSNVGGRIFSNQPVSAALPLKNGRWLVVYNKGVVICDSLFKNVLASFGRAQGIYDDNFHANACKVLPGGDIMLGTNDGVFMYHIGSNSYDAHSLPALYFSDIKVNDNNYSFNKEANYVDAIKLPYDKNTISFSFSTVDFNPSVNKRLEYKMLGADKEWIPAQRNGFARYANLQPGDYTFMLRNYGDSTNLTFKKIQIAIGSPFWRKWWFIILSIAAIFMVGYLVYLYRIQELIRLQRVRNKIATDLHDDIGSTLTNINILAALSYNNIHNKEKAADFVKRISEEANATSESLDDIVWSINTSNDSFNEMTARMRRYAAEIFEPGNIAWQIEFDEMLASKKLKMGQRRDIYLIYKEAINNIYKHARAKKVKVSLALKKNNLLMTIQDDGIGFNTSAPTSRNGVKNMHMRAENWKGSYNIESSAEGTIITVIMVISSSSLK